MKDLGLGEGVSHSKHILFHQNVQKRVIILIRSLIIVFVWGKKEVIIYICLSVHIKIIF